VLEPRDLPLLPVFVAVATLGSFTGAAREMRLTKGVVSHHVRTLEARLGVRLLERTTRRLHLTQVGEQVFEAAREVLESVRGLERVVEGTHGEPSGTLRLSAPHEPGFSSLVVPVCAKLMKLYPRVQVDLRFDDAIHDLVAQGLDVALRLGPLASSGYIVRRLGDDEEIIVASASLVRNRPGVASPTELDGTPWVCHSVFQTKDRAVLFREDGQREEVAFDVTARASSTTALCALVVEGVGYGILPRGMVARELASGILRDVCPGWFQRKLVVQALLPARHPPPRVRVFLEALAEAMAPPGPRAKSRASTSDAR
jgi:DNA-binding transcriptional LysR family regulator